MYRLARFFEGRYGVDKLFYAISVFAAALAVVNIFARSWILQLIVYAVFILALLRTLSRNREKRYAENARFCAVFDKITAKFRLLRRMWQDRKTHCYVKCDSCKKTLRLPKKKGVHTVKCPNCGNMFQVKI